MARGTTDRIADVLLAAGNDALAEGRWADAVEALTRAVAAFPETAAGRAQAATALSEACWWLGQVDQALASRADAYEVWRARGDDVQAAMAALWLAREYADAAGNRVASQGWLARAETLAGQPPSPAVAGWLHLTTALLSRDPRTQVAAAEEALRAARTSRDRELEVLALGRAGLARIATGDVRAGLRIVDEAMAAATGGEVARATLAALCCELVAASELSGEIDRFAGWNEVIESLAVHHGHPPLIAFCATCCAQAFAADGDWAGAERELVGALEQLRRTGHVARCVAPAARLAQLLVDQGRFEEAEHLLGDDQSDESLLVRARLALEGGRPGSAVVLAERHHRRHGGDSLLTTPSLALLVAGHLAAGDRVAAAATAERLEAIARASEHGRVAGIAALAAARVALADGDGEAASARLEEALDHLSAHAPGAVETADAHLELARLRAGDAPDVARAEAKAALAGFEAAGATHRASATKALLRELGDRSQVGAKQVGVLTNREQEVLLLVAQGLTNGEIAERLYISTKTAGNHVSNILAKLGLRSRVEAATYAALHAADHR